MKIHSLVLILSVSLSAHAHIRAKTSGNLVWRSNSDSLKAAPCGGVARTLSSAQYAPGDTITINWEETINHPGRFEIYFSASGDMNWQLLKTIPDNMNNTNDLPHQFSTTVTLPTTPCTACTLQLIQVMTENPTNPSMYYACSDIRTASAIAPEPVRPQPTPLPCD